MWGTFLRLSNALRNTSPTFAAKHDKVPWQAMYAMRNRVSHGYDKVDFEIIWRTIHGDLPDLYRLIQQIDLSD